MHRQMMRLAAGPGAPDANIGRCALSTSLENTVRHEARQYDSEHSRNLLNFEPQQTELSSA
jgi:hypothetical protein